MPRGCTLFHPSALNNISDSSNVGLLHDSRIVIECWMTHLLQMIGYIGANVLLSQTVP